MTVSPGMMPLRLAGVPETACTTRTVRPSCRVSGTSTTFTPDPSMFRAAILAKIVHDLFDGLHRQRVNGASIVRAGTDQADHLAARVEQRPADLAGADRHRGVNVRGGKKTC